MVGSGKPKTIAAHTVPPDETHHLDCFALCAVEQQPLTQSSLMSKTTTSVTPSACSLKRTWHQPSAFGKTDTSVERFEGHEHQEAFAAHLLIEELFAKEPTTEEFNSDVSSRDNQNKNNCMSSVDAAPVTTLVSRTTQGVCSKRPLRLSLDSGSTINFIHKEALPKAAKP